MPKLSHISPEQKVTGTRSLELAQPELLAEALMNGGMTTDFDPADIPNNKSPLVVNARIRRDKTSRRAGKVQFGDNKPNSEPVYALIQFNVASKTRYFIRIAGTGGHFFSGISGWIPLTGSLGGRITDRAVVLGNLILADGVKKLQLVDLTAETISDLGDIAPTAKWVTGFSERAVAANGGMSDEASETIYWSGNRNLTVWDALVDISAGQKRLDTSPRTEVDPISGVFGFSSVMVIPRERSIWLATQNPVASDPFKFFRSVPGVGCNLPGSIAVGRELLVFIDSRMRDVVIYRPGQNIETVGLAIRNDIIKGIQDADGLVSAYLTNEQEYHVLVEGDGSFKIWVFNFLTQAWSYDELPDCSSIDVFDDLSPYTSFDDLVGTFDSLTGTFDELSATPAELPTLVYGFENGDLSRENSVRENDFRESAGDVTYEFEYRSKEFKTPKDDIVINRIEIEYQCEVDGLLTLEYSKDGGETWVTAKTITLITGKVELLKFKKQIRTRRLMWRLLATDALFDLVGFEVDAAAVGESRN